MDEQKGSFIEITVQTVGVWNNVAQTRDNLLSFGWFHLWARSFSFDLASSVYRNNSCFSLNSKNQLSCKEPRSVLKNLHRLLLIHCTFPWWFWVVFVVQNNFFAKNQKAFGDFQKQFTVFSFCVLGHSCFSLAVMNVFFCVFFALAFVEK